MKATKLLGFLVVPLLLGGMKTEQCYGTGLTSRTIQAGTRINDISPVSTSEDINFRTFEIDAEEAGEYYIEFWLMPAINFSREYSQYTVLVNQHSAGRITPQKGNWQGLRMDGNRPVVLKKGKNEIKIGTPAPETPMVEAISVSTGDREASFDDSAYQAYLSEVTKSPSEKETLGNVIFSSSMASDNEYVFENVPIEYSFNTIQSLTEGQDFFITSSSNIPHDIDLIIFGTPFGSSSFNTTNGFDIKPGLIQPYSKFLLVHDPATPAEMQGLNWKGRSEYSINSTAYLATIHFTVPKTGYYILRWRTRQNGVKGVADININGTYFYENVPISYSYFTHTIPSDGNTYATMTKSSSTKVDPILFIHSFAGDKVVGVNDDGNDAKRIANGLTCYDSYIEQPYRIRTAGISVCNYSSQNPKSTCNVIVRNTSSAVKSREYDMSLSGMDKIEKSLSNLTSVSIKSVNRNLHLKSIGYLRSVSVYTVGGEIIARLDLKGSEAQISFESLNIHRSGLYIVTVSTDDTTVSEKIIVK